MCVGGLKFECAFSMYSSPALKRSSQAQNAFVPCAKSVRLQHNKCIHLLFGRWSRKPPKKKQELRKSFGKTSFQLRMGLKKDKNKAEVKERKKTT